MPLIDWFRGLSIDAARLDDVLSLHGELRMIHLEIEPPTAEDEGGLKLPGLGSLFGGRGKSASDEKEELPAPVAKPVR